MNYLGLCRIFLEILYFCVSENDENGLSHYDIGHRNEKYHRNENDYIKPLGFWLRSLNSFKKTGQQGKNKRLSR